MNRMRGLIDKAGKWWGTKANPISVEVVAGSTGEGTAGNGEVEVTNWPATVNTFERPFRIVDYGYQEIPAGGGEVTIDPQGRTFSLRNFDMEDTIFFALEPGRTDTGIPILPRNATRGYVTDGPVYVYANAAQAIRVYYLFVEMREG